MTDNNQRFDRFTPETCNTGCGDCVVGVLDHVVTPEVHSEASVRKHHIMYTKKRTVHSLMLSISNNGAKSVAKSGKSCFTCSYNNTGIQSI